MFQVCDWTGPLILGGRQFGIWANLFRGGIWLIHDWELACVDSQRWIKEGAAFDGWNRAAKYLRPAVWVWKIQTLGSTERPDISMRRRPGNSLRNSTVEGSNLLISRCVQSTSTWTAQQTARFPEDSTPVVNCGLKRCGFGQELVLKLFSDSAGLSVTTTGTITISCTTSVYSKVLTCYCNHDLVSDGPGIKAKMSRPWVSRPRPESRQHRFHYSDYIYFTALEINRTVLFSLTYFTFLVLCIVS